MKHLIRYIKTFFLKNIAGVYTDKHIKNFYELSSKDRIKIMRAAGKEAQKEQQLLLSRYNSQLN